MSKFFSLVVGAQTDTAWFQFGHNLRTHGTAVMLVPRLLSSPPWSTSFAVSLASQDESQQTVLPTSVEHLFSVKSDFRHRQSGQGLRAARNFLGCFLFCKNRKIVSVWWIFESLAVDMDARRFQVLFCFVLLLLVRDTSPQSSSKKRNGKNNKKGNWSSKLNISRFLKKLSKLFSVFLHRLYKQRCNGGAERADQQHHPWAQSAERAASAAHRWYYYYFRLVPYSSLNWGGRFPK